MSGLLTHATHARMYIYMRARGIKESNGAHLLAFASALRTKFRRSIINVSRLIDFLRPALYILSED